MVIHDHMSVAEIAVSSGINHTLDDGLVENIIALHIIF
jgi:hypothetical protein